MIKSIFISIFLSVFSFINYAQNAQASSITGKISTASGTVLRGIKIEIKNYSVKEVKEQFFHEGKAIVNNCYVDPNGKYAFKSLPEGNYYLAIEFPQKMEKAYEYIQKPAMPIKLDPGQNINNSDYTLKQIRAIMSGKVYKKNAVTLYTNISLELSCNDKIYSYATTNEKGEYVFVFEPAAGQWKITVKDTEKIIPYPLNLDLRKIDIFENINVICGK